MINRLATALSAAAAVLATPALAADLRFTFTGPDASSTFSFVVDERPLVTDFTDHDFTLYDVASNRDVGGSFDYLAQYTFSDADYGGGFASQLDTLFVQGKPLFEGLTSAPRFLTGDYELTDFGGQTYSLSIAAVGGAAVPEPATWALMIAGFGVTGATLRRRRREAETTSHCDEALHTA